MARVRADGGDEGDSVHRNVRPDSSKSVAANPEGQSNERGNHNRQLHSVSSDDHGRHGRLAVGRMALADCGPPWCGDGSSVRCGKIAMKRLQAESVRTSPVTKDRERSKSVFHRDRGMHSETGDRRFLTIRNNDTSSRSFLASNQPSPTPDNHGFCLIEFGHDSQITSSKLHNSQPTTVVESFFAARTVPLAPSEQQWLGRSSKNLLLPRRRRLKHWLTRPARQRSSWPLSKPSTTTTVPARNAARR